MKPWFRLTVTLTLVCLAPVCLLLSLSQPTRLNHSLYVVGLGPWFDQGREPASDSPTASLVRSMEFNPVRAGPLECPVLDCALPAGNLDPPGHVIYGPPGPMGLGELPAKPATQTNAIQQPSHLHEITDFQHRIPESCFCNSL